MADASEIREHMEVIASDGQHVGIVDRMQGPDTIKLARQSGGHGHHHLIPLSWVDHVDAHVHLDKPGEYVAQNWQHGH